MAPLSVMRTRQIFGAAVILVVPLAFAGGMLLKEHNIAAEHPAEPQQSAIALHAQHQRIEALRKRERLLDDERAELLAKLDRVHERVK